VPAAQEAPWIVPYGCVSWFNVALNVSGRPTTIVCDDTKFTCARIIANVIMKMIQTRLREFMIRSPGDSWMD
jgi:hypothetical protein